MNLYISVRSADAPLMRMFQVAVRDGPSCLFFFLLIVHFRFDSHRTNSLKKIALRNIVTHSREIRLDNAEKLS